MAEFGAPAMRERFFARPGVALAILFAVALFSYVDRSLVSILQVPIQEELGLSDTQLGALTGLSFAILYATAAIPLARFVDRGNRTRLMAAALFVWTAMTALSGFAGSFAMLVVLRMGVAIGEAGSLPATHSLLSDYFPLSRRGKAFAVWALASPAGVMLGILFGGWIGSELGWRHSFLYIGLAGFLAVPLVLLLIEPRRGRYDIVAPQEATMTLREALLALWRIRPLRTLVAAAALYSFTYMALLNWLPPFLARAHKLPIEDVATIAAILIGVGGGIGALFGGVIVDLLIRRDIRWYAWAPAITAFLLVPATLGFLFVANLAVATGFGFLAIMFATFLIAPTNSLAQSMVTSDLRGVTSALLVVVPTIAGLGFGPLFTGAVSDAVTAMTGSAAEGIRYALTLSLAAVAVGGLFYLRLARQLDESPVPLRGPEGAKEH